MEIVEELIINIKFMGTGMSKKVFEGINNPQPAQRILEEERRKEKRGDLSEKEMREKTVRELESIADDMIKNSHQLAVKTEEEYEKYFTSQHSSEQKAIEAIVFFDNSQEEKDREGELMVYAVWLAVKKRRRKIVVH